MVGDVEYGPPPPTEAQRGRDLCRTWLKATLPGTLVLWRLGNRGEEKGRLR